MSSIASGRASIAVCDRCNMKMSYMNLRPDGNSPGLRVCNDCWDPLNPYRLPPIEPDSLTLRFPRPDTELIVGNIAYLDITIPPLPVPTTQVSFSNGFSNGFQ